MNLPVLLLIYGLLQHRDGVILARAIGVHESHRCSAKEASSIPRLVDAGG